MLGNRLRSLLESSDKNASDLARFCNVSAQSAHNWLNDIAYPRPAKKDLIAEFFGITPQELEYSQVLSLTPMARTTLYDAAAPTVAICEQAANMLITTEISKQPRSTEFVQGMRDKLVSLLAQTEINSHFQQGTIQADAYYAGCLHAERIISTIQKK